MKGERGLCFVHRWNMYSNVVQNVCSQQISTTLAKLVILRTADYTPAVDCHLECQTAYPLRTSFRGISHTISNIEEKHHLIPVMATGSRCLVANASISDFRIILYWMMTWLRIGWRFPKIVWAIFQQAMNYVHYCSKIETSSVCHRSPLSHLTSSLDRRAIYQPHSAITWPMGNGNLFGKISKPSMTLQKTWKGTLLLSTRGLEYYILYLFK